MRRSALLAAALVPTSLGLLAPAAAHAHLGTGGPAGGAALLEVVIATTAAVLATTALVLAGVRHRRSRDGRLARVAEAAARQVHLPPWAALPTLLTTASLLTALLGMYWDISLHIDDGRDSGPLANPAHYFILFGLFGLFASGFLATVLPEGRPGRSAIHLRGEWYAPVGGLMLLGCGAFSLSAFPLDDMWHRLFGQDVTLWGPTHLMLIGGAGLSLLGLVTLQVEGRRAFGTVAEARAPSLLRRFQAASVMGGLLVGLSTFQAEFDFGVPQFRLLFHPVLLMLAASIALTAGRVYGGKGTAIAAVAFFWVERGLVTLLVGPGFGEATAHLPLYAVEAGLVELVAWRVGRDRPLLLGAWSGLLIGTVGLATEWGWSWVWMPLPWPAAMFPEAAVAGLVAALAGSVIGAAIGASLRGIAIGPRAVTRAALTAAACAVPALVAYGLVSVPDPNVSARVSLEEVGRAPERTVAATVTLDPPSAGVGAEWLTVTAWQGKGLVVDRLAPVAPGVYRTTQPIPVHGSWKALVRLHRDRSLLAMPMFLPADAAIPAPEVPATAQLARPFGDDRSIMQREFTGGAASVWTVANLVVLVLSLALVALLGWGLRRVSRMAPGASAPPRAVDGLRAESAPRGGLGQRRAAVAD